ncbi:MAG: 30S ribosomal protein S8 [Gammaproteobacteria bacterium RIFCSPHIGHO2_12_FULL_37_34]|nr:MAG: 30S ribosomal protein S8 [Gammaproteobacteria bacterium RIFCSPHIGHO2_12_FULL_37_34]
MSMQDPIADMLTSIRNAQKMGHREVVVPYSRFKTEILTILKKEGFVEDFQIIATDNKKNITVVLRYYQGSPVIEKIERISRPALRVYRNCDQLPVVRGGLGIAIVSTPLGVMTDKTARTERVGGEVLCTVE